MSHFRVRRVEKHVEKPSYLVRGTVEYAMKLLRKVLAGTIVAALNITTCGSLRRSTSDPIILLVNRTTQPHRALPVNRDFFFLSPGRGRAVITTMTIVYICRDILFFLPQDLHVRVLRTHSSEPSVR